MTPALLTPFFERCENSIDGFPPDSYVAGFREPDGGQAKVQMSIPADIVECTVLGGAQLSIWLRAADGKLILDGEGLGNAALEAALVASPMQKQTLRTLVAACVDADHLAAENDPIGDLRSLKAQLADALITVDSALERLAPTTPRACTGPE